MIWDNNITLLFGVPKRPMALATKNGHAAEQLEYACRPQREASGLTKNVGCGCVSSDHQLSGEQHKLTTHEFPRPTVQIVQLGGLQARTVDNPARM